MKFATALWIFGLLCLLASGCVQQHHRPTPVIAPEAKLPVIVTEGKPVDNSLRDITTLMNYAQRVRTLNAEELNQEFNAVSQAFAKKKSDLNKMRLGILFSLPYSTFRDDAAALNLLDEYLATSSVEDKSVLKSYAKSLFATITEQKKQDERIQKLIQKVKDEQKRADALQQKNEELQQKLDAIKSIEKNMIERDNGRAISK